MYFLLIKIMNCLDAGKSRHRHQNFSADFFAIIKNTNL